MRDVTTTASYNESWILKRPAGRGIIVQASAIRKWMGEYVGQANTMPTHVAVKLQFDSMPSLREVAAMRPEEREKYIIESARILRDDYLKDPEMTVFTSLDSEDFYYGEQG